MDSLSPLLASTEIIPVKNVLLLASDAAARLYLDKVYDYYADIIVCSAEGGFPQQQELWQRAMHSVAEDASINLIICGCDALQKVKPATAKILILDDLIMSDASPSARKPGMGLDARKVALLIKSFLDQDKKLKMGLNFRDGYAGFREWSARGWMTDLLL